MRFWRAVQTAVLIAGWCFVAIALLGVVNVLSGGDPEHGTAAGKLCIIVGVPGAVCGLIIGHRRKKNSSRGFRAR